MYIHHRPFVDPGALGKCAPLGLTSFSYNFHQKLRQITCLCLHLCVWALPRRLGNHLSATVDMRNRIVRSVNSDLENISLCRATTFNLYHCWNLPWVFKKRWIYSLDCFHKCTGYIHRSKCDTCRSMAADPPPPLPTCEQRWEVNLVILVTLSSARNRLAIGTGLKSFFSRQDLTGLLTHGSFDQIRYSLRILPSSGNVMHFEDSSTQTEIIGGG